MKTTIIAAAFLSLAFAACKKDHNCKCAPHEPGQEPPPVENRKCPPPPLKPIKAIVSKIRN
jgi:hypothetical protein